MFSAHIRTDRVLFQSFDGTCSSKVSPSLSCNHTTRPNQPGGDVPSKDEGRPRTVSKITNKDRKKEGKHRARGGKHTRRRQTSSKLVGRSAGLWAQQSVTSCTTKEMTCKWIR